MTVTGFSNIQGININFIVKNSKFHSTCTSRWLCRFTINYFYCYLFTWQIWLFKLKMFLKWPETETRFKRLEKHEGSIFYTNDSSAKHYENSSTYLDNTAILQFKIKDRNYWNTAGKGSQYHNTANPNVPLSLHYLCNYYGVLHCVNKATEK